MSVGTGGINVSSDVYTSYVKSAEPKENTKPAETVSSGTAESTGAVYEKSTEVPAKEPYKINKMTQEERDAIVSQMKADLQTRQQQLQSIVSQMLGQQATAFGIANDDDSIWKFLAKGDFTVDEAAKVQAQQDISEDGYFGVKQTSERLFDFASALAGDDVDKMKKMQEAMHKGFEQATKSWGKELPDISKDTIKAADKLFEDYYASKETNVEA